MKKKMVSLFLTACLLLSSSALTVSASDYDPASSQNAQYFFNGVNVDNQPVARSNDADTMTATSETILTRHSDGTVSETVYDYSQSAVMARSGGQLNVSEYLPASSTISTFSSTADAYGREITSPTENRSGHLMCGYNSDADADIEVYYYGTASLQNYDLLISCAHCVWMPQYADLASDGWASVLTFYAGRTGEYTYASTANFTNVSVSQNYVDNTTYYLDADGNPVVSPDYDWDWSIIQIDTNLGGTYGWFGLHGCGTAEDGLSIYTVGYPGNSGGPLLNGGSVYGIATFYAYNDSTPWLYSGGTRMYDGLFNMIVDAREASAARWE